LYLQVGRIPLTQNLKKQDLAKQSTELCGCNAVYPCKV
jgi:hypothetical protein